MLKSLLICLSVALYVIGSTNAPTAFIPADPNHKGKCFSESTGLLEPGTEKDLANCSKAICGGDGTIQIHACFPMIYGSGNNCTVVDEKQGKPYPECCPITKCDD